MPRGRPRTRIVSPNDRHRGAAATAVPIVSPDANTDDDRPLSFDTPQMDDMTAKAEQVEAEVSEQGAPPEPKRPRGRKPKEATTVIEPDPALTGMVFMSVDSVVILAKIQLKWTDPGQQWRQSVAEILTRIIQKNSANWLAEYGDEVILIGLIAQWAVPQVFMGSRRPAEAPPIVEAVNLSA